MALSSLPDDAAADACVVSIYFFSRANCCRGSSYSLATRSSDGGEYRFSSRLIHLSSLIVKKIFFGPNDFTLDFSNFFRQFTI